MIDYGSLPQTQQTGMTALRVFDQAVQSRSYRSWVCIADSSGSRETADPESVDLGQDPRVCISHLLPGAVDGFRSVNHT